MYEFALISEKYEIAIVDNPTIPKDFLKKSVDDIVSYIAVQIIEVITKAIKKYNPFQGDTLKQVYSFYINLTAGDNMEEWLDVHRKFIEEFVEAIKLQNFRWKLVLEPTIYDIEEEKKDMNFYIEFFEDEPAFSDFSLKSGEKVPLKIMLVALDTMIKCFSHFQNNEKEVTFEILYGTIEKAILHFQIFNYEYFFEQTIIFFRESIFRISSIREGTKIKLNTSVKVD